MKKIFFLVIFLAGVFLINSPVNAVNICVDWTPATATDVVGYKVYVGETEADLSPVFQGEVAPDGDGICRYTITDQVFIVGNTYCFSVAAYTAEATGPLANPVEYTVLSEHSIGYVSISQLFNEIDTGTYIVVKDEAGDYTITPVEDPDPDPDGTTINLAAQTWVVEPAVITGGSSYDGSSFVSTGNCHFHNDNLIIVDSTNHWLNIPVKFSSSDIAMVLQFRRNGSEWLRWGLSSGSQFIDPFNYNWSIAGSTTSIQAGAWVIVSVDLYAVGFQNGDTVDSMAFSSTEGVMFDDPTFSDATITPDPDPTTINLAAQTWVVEPAVITGGSSYDGSSFVSDGNCHFHNDNLITIDETNHWLNIPVRFTSPDTDMVLQFRRNDSEWLRWGLSSGSQFVDPFNYNWSIAGSTTSIQAGAWVIVSVDLYAVGFQNGDTVDSMAFSSTEGVMFDDPTFTSAQ